MEYLIMSDDRLERMEGKIDKLVEAVLTMAHLHGAVERVEERIGHLEEDVTEIQKRIPIIDLMISSVNKVVGAIIVVVVGAVAGAYFVF